MFKQFSQFKSLHFAATMTEIHANFFGGAVFTGDSCTIQTVSIIGARAFENCFKNPITLTIGSSVTYFGSAMFYNCTIDVLKISSGQSLGRGGLMGVTCKSVEINNAQLNKTWLIGPLSVSKLILRGESLSISNSFFENTSFTGDLFVGENVQVQSGAFANAHFAGSLEFQAKVNIDSAMFKGSNKWTGNLTIGDKVLSIGDNAFDGLFKKGQTLTIGSGITQIGANAFRQCKFSGVLTLGSNIIRVSQNAFQGSNISSLMIFGNGITLGQNAFKDCGALSTVHYCGSEQVSFTSPVFDNQISTISVVSLYTFKTFADIPMHQVKCEECGYTSGDQCVDSQSPSPTQVSSTPTPIPHTPTHTPIPPTDIPYDGQIPNGVTNELFIQGDASIIISTTKTITIAPSQIKSSNQHRITRSGNVKSAGVILKNFDSTVIISEEYPLLTLYNISEISFEHTSNLLLKSKVKDNSLAIKEITVVHQLMKLTYLSNYFVMHRIYFIQLSILSQ